MRPLGSWSRRPSGSFAGQEVGLFVPSSGFRLPTFSRSGTANNLRVRRAWAIRGPRSHRCGKPPGTLLAGKPSGMIRTVLPNPGVWLAPPYAPLYPTLASDFPLAFASPPLGATQPAPQGAPSLEGRPYRVNSDGAGTQAWPSRGPHLLADGRRVAP